MTVERERRALLKLLIAGGVISNTAWAGLQEEKKLSTEILEKAASLLEAGIRPERIREILPAVQRNRDFFQAVRDLEIGDDRAADRIPVDHPLAAVDEALFVQAHERLAHRLVRALVHREALALPVERGLQSSLIGAAANRFCDRCIHHPGQIAQRLAQHLGRRAERRPELPELGAGGGRAQREPRLERVGIHGERCVVYMGLRAPRRIRDFGRSPAR